MSDLANNPEFQGLLPVKCHTPRPRKNDLTRPRLIEHMEEGLSRRLTIVSAPPGWGKTTLAAQWSKSTPVRVAWLHLDVSDNDPARFLQGLLGAFWKIYPSIGKDLLAQLQSEQKPSMEQVLRKLLQDVNLYLSQFAIVLDDYHLIQSAPVHNMIAFLVNYMPEQMHLYLLTRTDPPFALSELRGHDQLKEIRTPYLGFTMDEASDLFNELLQLQLPFGEITVMMEKTRAHPGLLKLAGLALSRGLEREAFIRELEGIDRVETEFLVNKLLSVLPEDFTRQIALFAYVVLFPQEAAQRIPGNIEHLNKLAEEGIFLSDFGGTEKWYRFYSYLGAVLPGATTEVISKTERREALITVADWFFTHDFWERGFSLAMQAQAMDLAAQVVETHAQEMLRQGELITVETWLEQLPDSLAKERPMLAVCQAWVALIRQNLPAAAQYVQMARRALKQPAEKDELHSHIQAIEEFLAEQGSGKEPPQK